MDLIDRRSPLALLCVIALLALAACATVSRSTFDQGRAMIEAGQVIEGLAHVEQATREEPLNQEYRNYYLRQRQLVGQRFVTFGDNARAAGLLDQAAEAYRNALVVDPDSTQARAGTEQLEKARRHLALLGEAQDLLRKGDQPGALAKAKQILAENPHNRDAQSMARRIEAPRVRAAATPPQLSAALRKPITVEFRDAPIRSLFEFISKQTGLNFILDREIPADQTTTLFVRNTSVDEVIRFVLVTSQLERKVLNENTLFIYPNTPAKAKDYRELVVRSFYLENVDVKPTADMIKALVKTNDMYMDEKLNLLVMRDTPEAIRIAERLIANQDLPEPEVMLELEVLEVGSSLLSEIGVQWPDRLGLGLVGAAGVPGAITLAEWLNRNASLVRMTINDPVVALNLKKQDGRTSILANPRIRVKNKEKARIHIGDKVPVITTTTTATGFASESVSYLDVGLKLEVEPQVFLANEVGIKIGLEVSNIVQQIKSATGSVSYQVGTRNAATVLRLKDGETQVLAGLINNEDRRAAARIPGLGDLPTVGRLFSNRNETVNRTEIVLLVTPRVVRNLPRPDAASEEFASGTDAQIGGDPLRLSNEPAPAPGPRSEAVPAQPTPQAQATKPASSQVRFDLDVPQQTAAGEEFPVEVNLSGDAALRSARLEVMFDPARVRFVRAEPGDLLANAGKQAVKAKAAGGKVSLTLGANSVLLGSGQAAKLVFKALAASSTPPEVYLQVQTMTDGQGRTISIRESDRERMPLAAAR